MPRRKNMIFIQNMTINQKVYNRRKSVMSVILILLPTLSIALSIFEKLISIFEKLM